MTNYLIDSGDADFTQTICSALDKRGVEWSILGDQGSVQTISKERQSNYFRNIQSL